MAALPAEPAPPVTAPTAAPAEAPTVASTVASTKPSEASNTEPAAAPTAASNTALNPTPPINLRAPSNSRTPSSITLSPPTLSWLQGSWNVTHSTLPMWRKSRNVRIKYTAVPNSGSAGGRGHVGGTHLDDQVTYQGLDKSKTKVSTVRGVDKPFATAAGKDGGNDHNVDTAPPPATSAGEELASLGYMWRGKGLLFIATSKWEILGYGDEEGGNSWVVTYFAKTLFTPAGADFYSRKGRLQEETVRGIKEAIKGLGGDVARLGVDVFEVAYDGERDGDV